MYVYQLNVMYIQYSFKKLVCKIMHALHKRENIHCMLACALEVYDVVLIACGQYKHSLWAKLTRNMSGTRHVMHVCIQAVAYACTL